MTKPNMAQPNMTKTNMAKPIMTKPNMAQSDMICRDFQYSGTTK